MEKRYVCQGCNDSVNEMDMRIWDCDDIKKDFNFCKTCYLKVGTEYDKNEYAYNDESKALYAVFPHLNPDAPKPTKATNTIAVPCPACREREDVSNMKLLNGVDFQLCRKCHSRTLNVWRMNDHTFMWETAVHLYPHLMALLPKDDGACNLGDINIREHVTKDEPSLFAVGALPKSNCIHTEKLDAERYTALEYADNEFEELNLGHGWETVKDLESMMDAALLGKDIEWAKELHEQIRIAKESISQ